MKYTIYKLSGKFNTYRWWRNYDNMHKDTPDTPIETYISAKGLIWSELKNSRNENIAYQTITKDSFDKISLKIADLKDIPDYIKIVFTKDNNTTESAYYYVDTPPSIYNARSSLASDVTYILDRKASFYYVFHNKLVTYNPQMFFVRKHHPRMLYDTTTSKYYFDVNKQPWLNGNDIAPTNSLIVKQKCKYTNHELENLTAATYSTSAIKFLYGYSHQEAGILLYSTDGGTTTQNIWNFPVLYDQGSEASTTISLPINDYLFYDTTSGSYEYIITKPKLLAGGARLDDESGLYLWPVLKNPDSNYWGHDNTYNGLYKELGTCFANDNIVGRLITYLSPCNIILMTTGIYATAPTFTLNEAMIVKKTGGSGDTTSFGCISVHGVPNNIILNNTAIGKDALLFKTKLNTIINNFNNGIYSKSAENNPRLFAPQNLQLVYASSTNEKSILTSDYINLLASDWTINYTTLLIHDSMSRLGVSDWNENKQLSQTGNEMYMSDGRFAPIQSDAYNNTLLQRQILDTGRNTQVTGQVTSLMMSTLMITLGTLITAISEGTLAPIGIGGILGGTAGIVKGTVGTQTSEAQYQAQLKALNEQSNQMNVPASISGLTMLKHSWNDKCLNLYTMELSAQDKAIINNDDNKFGYKIKSWLPYSNYLTCWDGNYMLCDMSQNYSNIFNILKSLDSIFTIDDNYINDFINALNNGITWYDQGNYVDLATDLLNWERTFPRHS